ncbi:MAG: 5-bromo-4-chloroindolyl phosphate hydrolysis family protein, partial [Niameybacter sp.]
ETIIVKIFDSVERNPKYTGDMRKFMEYYLPTTLKLVKAYGEFERVDIQGENITTAKKEIEETLDTINEAFEHFLDDLYQEAAFDVTTDAEVLQSMLARDGWTETDFK